MNGKERTEKRTDGARERRDNDLKEMTEKRKKGRQERMKEIR